MSEKYQIKVKDFHLDHIFDCGQCFRWNKEEDGSYTGVAFGKAVNMSLDGDLLTIDGSTEEDFLNIWKDYLDLDFDYGQVKEKLAAEDRVIGMAISEGQGIRILKQDLWETIVSFIISANNNIPRIKKCIENLCTKYGDDLGQYRGQRRYSFPGADVLSKITVDDLAEIKLGYRAKYIVETAKKFVENPEKYTSLINDDIDGATALKVISKDKDTKLMGVGPKVANCITLFGMAKRDGFPIDVWIKRVMNHLYGFDVEDVNSMAKFAAERFGENAGIAQQYLFYYMRNKLD